MLCLVSEEIQLQERAMSATLVSNSPETQAVAAPQTSIHWFEIPCEDLDRATAFYETVLDAKLRKVTLGTPMALFPSGNGGTGGTLVQRSVEGVRQRAGAAGTMVYLNCNGRLDEAIESVSKAGGLMLLPKTEIEGGFGYFACLRDSEGNHVGLHSV
jgi:predicted enzyme related to lactoylglutathione lyase